MLQMEIRFLQWLTFNAHRLGQWSQDRLITSYNAIKPPNDPLEVICQQPMGFKHVVKDHNGHYQHPGSFGEFVKDRYGS